jgi:hypothetical protein
MQRLFASNSMSYLPRLFRKADPGWIDLPLVLASLVTFQHTADDPSCVADDRCPRREPLTIQPQQVTETCVHRVNGL